MYWYVVRAFDDENVMREQGRERCAVDPLADIDTINLRNFSRQSLLINVMRV